MAVCQDSPCHANSDRTVATRPEQSRARSRESAFGSTGRKLGRERRGDGPRPSRVRSSGTWFHAEAFVLLLNAYPVLTVAYRAPIPLSAPDRSEFGRASAPARRRD